MEGHEGRPFDPGNGNPEPAAGSLPPAEEELALAEHAAKLAVEMLEPIVRTIGEQIQRLADDVDERIAAMTAETDESRLDSLEARIKMFGQGGDSLGDAFAIAEHALACARHIVGELGKITGSVITLPPTPQYVGPLEPSRVEGAEMANVV